MSSWVNGLAPSHVNCVELHTFYWQSAIYVEIRITIKIIFKDKSVI